MKIITQILFLITILASCKNREINNNTIIKPDTLPVSKKLIQTDSPPVFTRSSINSTFQKKVTNKSVDEITIISTSEENDEDFNKYYLFKIKNNTQSSLKSFKFLFVSCISNSTDNTKSKKVEKVVIKKTVDSGETALIRVYPPISWNFAKEKEREIITESPYLEIALDSHGQTVFGSGPSELLQSLSKCQ